MKQTYNDCAETHLDGGVMSPFVSPLSAIAQAHDPTLISSVALRKGPRRFCLHCTDPYVSKLTVVATFGGLEECSVFVLAVMA